MKELSIEEKAKAYDESRERMKDFLKEWENCGALGEAMEKAKAVFPELKEWFEDEKIRKEIIVLIEWSISYSASGITNDDAKKMLAWLEKQGEHANFRNKIQIGDKVTRNEDGVLVNLSQLNRVAKKQDGQKPIFEMKTPEESLNIDSDTYNKIVDECIYDEQKPADKVESKFKFGDWVVYDHRTYQVVELPKDGYINLGLRRNGKIEFAPSTYCRHWTIEDAKDGDVLCYKDGQWCFIYKGIVTEDTFKYYALLSEKGITINDAAFSLLTSCIIPATKEQRELLFQKMKESGYEWDANKKELKKIEQKTAWSEEDEKMLNACTEFIGSTICTNYGEEDGVTKQSCRNWLKSLKDRVQPKQEWSEEDEYNLACLLV